MLGVLLLCWGGLIGVLNDLAKGGAPGAQHPPYVRMAQLTVMAKACDLLQFSYGRCFCVSRHGVQSFKWHVVAITPVDGYRHSVIDRLMERGRVTGKAAYEAKVWRPITNST